VRGAAQGKGTEAAKEREESDAAATALRSRVGPSLNLRFRDRSGTPSHISAKSLQTAAKGLPPGPDRDVATAREFLRVNRKLFGVEDPDRELTVTRKQRDRLNFGQVRLEQNYQGLAVWPSELLVHLNSDGDVYRANGGLIRTPKHLSIQPTIGKDAATQLARQAVAAGPQAEAHDQQLIVYASEDGPVRLAWKVGIRAGVAADWLVVVDAHAGAVLTKFNQIADATVPGQGLDLFGTPRNVSVWEDGGSFFLIDTSKQMFNAAVNPVEFSVSNGAIYILDAANTPSDPFTQSPDVFFVTSNNPATFSLPDAVSAAFGLSETYDYFLERHARNSIDGEGGAMIAVVRVSVQFDNAFWDPQLQRMNFGDAEPFAGALDVVAHELTHGVTNHSADLVYEGQSGALNESFSDIFGEMVEARTVGAPDWALGSRLGAPARDLRDPSLHGDPSKMSEFVFTQEDNGGVHTNSGIFNHAFYLLAEGLPGAVGIRDAEQIFYRALTVHLFKSARFIDARLACIDAAEELFGPGSAQAAKVAQAFDEVEIFDAAPSAPPTPFPQIQSPDSTLFVFFDSDVGAHRLGRRETALGDDQLGAILSVSTPSLTRPTVSGDGFLAAFVDSTHDVCIFSTEDSEPQDCVGLPDTFYSIAMSPQGDRVAVILQNEFGDPENRILIIDVINTAETREIVLRAPLIDGGGSVQVDFADAMAFSSSGDLLFYDAFNEVNIGDGATYGTWSIYAIELATDLILPIVPPLVGLDFAFPALSKTSDNFLVFDASDPLENTSVVFAMNLFTGDIGAVGEVVGGLGAPSFLGDDRALIYSIPSDTPTGFSLVRQELGPDTLSAIGNPTTWLEDADFGVIYRRGQFQAPPETDNCPDDPNKTEPGICGCGVPDMDGDGVGLPDCFDGCPDDPDKTEPGECGCDVPDVDSDGDDVPDCFDGCPDDPDKTEPGECGCGVPENRCGSQGSTGASRGGCGAGIGMILLMLPVLGMARLIPARKRRHSGSSAGNEYSS